MDWSSHLQETAAGSTNTAEYVALWEAPKTVLGIANIVHEMQVKTTLPKLYEDNVRMVRLATPGMEQAKTRYLI